MRAYNPLSVVELGRNSVRALMAYDIAPLPPVPSFVGAGVYTIHYFGSFEPYAGLTDPIYVGKADSALHRRLTDHAASVVAAHNIAAADFGCRWLVLDPIWISLIEQILIDQYNPIWNRTIKGFGNRPQGRTRSNQRRSQWDTVHSGRNWAETMKPRESSESLLERIAEHRASEAP